MASDFAIRHAVHIINRNGILYPRVLNERGLNALGVPGNDFAVTERSGGYRDLARLQREAMHLLEKVPPGVPIYFGQHEGYLNSYPAMGYVKNTMTNAESITYWRPERFALLLSISP